MLWKTLKQQQLVVAVHHLPSDSHFLVSQLISIAFIGLIFLGQPAFAETPQDQKHLMVQIHAHTPAELSGILKRAQIWADQFETYPEEPIAIVLHGPEANVFVKSNYSQYKPLVDLAAKLDAFNVVDVKICERWMGSNNVQKGQLPPFVETVPYGPAEQGRLIKAGYQAF